MSIQKVSILTFFAGSRAVYMWDTSVMLAV